MIYTMDDSLTIILNYLIPDLLELRLINKHYLNIITNYFLNNKIFKFISFNKLSNLVNIRDIGLQNIKYGISIYKSNYGYDDQKLQSYENLNIEYFFSNDNPDITDTTLLKLKKLNSLHLVGENRISNNCLIQLTNLTNLTLSYNNNLRDFKDFKLLKSLNLKNNITDDEISYLVNLEEYFVPRSSPLTNFALNKLVKLKKLHFCSNISEAFVSILTQITDLYLNGGSHPITISENHINKLTNLQKLIIWRRVKTDCILELSKLEYLEINNNGLILKSIDNLINLKHIKIFKVDNLSDIKFDKFINLKKLELSFIKIIDISDIKNFDLDLCAIGNIATCGLENLVNLRKLIIYEKENLADDILVNLTNLTYLKVGPNTNLVHKLLA
jgi:hypothetical protein